MPKNRSIIRGLMAASALFLFTTPALAGDEERALAAIAQAQGKVDAAAKLNASPDLLARAQASLRLAQEELKSGKEQKAIASAIDAQHAADLAIGQNKQQADAEAQDRARAQLQADAANARADAAERAAASAAADARAAQASASLAAATTPTTTVTTETVKSSPVTRSGTTQKRTVVKKKASAPAAQVAERTTTTVTTQN